MRKVRKERKVFSLISWEKKQMSSINVTIIHQFQSPNGKNFPHIPYIPQRTVRAARAGPRGARSTTVRVRASTGGKVVTKRLNNHRPMRVDIDIRCPLDEPVLASTVSSCPAIVVLLQDVRRKR